MKSIAARVPTSATWAGLALAAWACLAAPLTAADPEPDSPPVAPAASLDLLHVPDGFEVALVAAEPDVIDPVAFTWGPDGRLWVAEMSDYPLGMDGEGEPGGRIRWLRDRDGDGRYEESVVFAEDLAFPTGVLPWKDGALVTAAPLILYLEDTDGNGRADERHVLFEGFQEGNQQLRVNGLVRGLDNWIYCASGAHRANYGADNRIVSKKTGEEIALGSRDFRFRPETGELEPESGPSQFGRNRDDWGNWFGVMNSYPLWHWVLRDRYLRRNPHAAPPDPRRQLVLPKNPRVYPWKAPQERYHGFDQTGRFTSACSGMVYRDAALFPGVREDALEIFTCEPFANLVQHNRSAPKGISFTVSRDAPVERADGVDFFASKDRWCRPVSIRTGPGGGLWIADMYRYMIEHPQWLPEEGKEALRPFYRLGDDRGRIYRVHRAGSEPDPVPNLESRTTAELLPALESRNGWRRDTAQALLVARGDASAVPPLEALAVSRDAPALARLHALATLDGMGALTPALLAEAAADPAPGVRRHAVRLAEPFADDHPELKRAVLGLVDDPDARVRLQLACSLGEWSGARIATALGRLAFRDGDDPFAAAAVVSSLNAKNLDGVVANLLKERQRTGIGGGLLGTLLGQAVAFDRPGAIDGALGAILAEDADPAWRYRTAAELLDALERRRAAGNTGKAENAEKAPDGPGADIAARLEPLAAAARDTALDDDAPAGERTAAIRLMGRDPATRADDLETLGSLLEPRTPAAIQEAAVSHLGTLPADADVANRILANWPAFTPRVRAEASTVLTSRGTWASALLDAVADGAVTTADLDAATRERLRRHPEKAIRKRARRTLPATGSGDRHQVIQEWKPALQLEGDAERGKAVFAKLCVACHRLDGVGLELGPNLAAITDRRPESLLTAILDPNASVEGRYAAYAATTRGGRVLTGMLVSETGASITLRDAANREHTVRRADLVSLKSLGRSLMPEGLEAALSRQDLADLVRYLRRAR